MPPTVTSLQRKAELQGNPIVALQKFLKREEEAEAAGKAGRDKMRFVGYVLELGYRNAVRKPLALAMGMKGRTLQNSYSARIRATTS